MLICAMCETECKDDRETCPECGSAMLLPLLSDDDPETLLGALGRKPQDAEKQG